MFLDYFEEGHKGSNPMKDSNDSTTWRGSKSAQGAGAGAGAGAGVAAGGGVLTSQLLSVFLDFFHSHDPYTYEVPQSLQFSFTARECVLFYGTSSAPQPTTHTPSHSVQITPSPTPPSRLSGGFPARTLSHTPSQCPYNSHPHPLF